MALSSAGGKSPRFTRLRVLTEAFRQGKGLAVLEEYGALKRFYQGEQAERPEIQNHGADDSA